MKVSNTLIKLGLKPEEAEVYLACLRLGEPKVADIAQEIPAIPRTSIYVHAKSLADKGYLKRSRRHGSERFIATEPDQLLEDEKSRVLELESAIPAMMQMFDLKKRKAKVEYVDSSKGVLRLLEAMRKKSGQKQLYFIEPTVLEDILLPKTGSEHWEKWHAQLAKADTQIQGVTIPERIPALKKSTAKMQQKILERTQSIRVVDKKQLPFSPSLYLIPPGLAVIISYEENFAVSIENKAIYEMLHAFFMTVYQNGKPLDIRKALS